LQEVKGHQDENITALTHWEFLNVLVDTKAKEYRETIENNETTTTCYPVLPIARWTISVNHTTQICKNLPKTLQDHVSRQQMALQLESRNKSTQDQFHLHDWSALGKAMKSTTFHKRVWIAKHSSGNCGVNSMRKLRKETASEACPRCGLRETAEHVWLCQHPPVQDIWEKALLQLEPWLRSTTSNMITNQLLTYLRLWRSKTIPDPIPEQDSLSTQQQQIGWANVIEG
jgi:hypothetical protein